MVEAQLQLQLHVLKKRQSKTLLNDQIVQSDFFLLLALMNGGRGAVAHPDRYTVLLESGSQKLDMLMQ